MTAKAIARMKTVTLAAKKMTTKNNEIFGRTRFAVTQDDDSDLQTRDPS